MKLTKGTEYWAISCLLSREIKNGNPVYLFTCYYLKLWTTNHFYKKITLSSMREILYEYSTSLHPTRLARHPFPKPFLHAINSLVQLNHFLCVLE